MSLMISLSWVRPDEYMAVMNATANKLMDIATTQTGTQGDDWVVRAATPDGGTGPSGGPSGSQTPDFSLISGTRNSANQLGWDLDHDAIGEGASWTSVFTGTVDDNKYFAFYGAWEASSHASATDDHPLLPPVGDGWKFGSGSSVLDIYWMQGALLSSEAVGAITKSPVIYTQNSPIDLQVWGADTPRYASHADVDHQVGLFGLACEKVGKVISRPGFHGVVPLAMTTGDMYQKLQSTVANELINRAVAQTNVPADQWLVRPFILDDAGTGPLTSADLTGDGTLYGAGGGKGGAGWAFDASALSATAYTSVLTDKSVPDNKFFAFYGGFEHPLQAVTSTDAVCGPMINSWALTKGASTEAVWDVTIASQPYSENWGFWATQPVYYDQNDSIDILVLRNTTNIGDVDNNGGVLGLVCERVGENISASKVSQG